MRTNNNLVDFSKEYTYVASESLVQDTVIYTLISHTQITEDRFWTRL